MKPAKTYQNNLKNNKMKTTTLILGILMTICLSSCQRGCQSFERKFQSSKMYYDIKIYSGGQIIYHDSLKTIINNSENSDGYYYYKGDTLIEICGEAVIKGYR